MGNFREWGRRSVGLRGWNLRGRVGYDRQRFQGHQFQLRLQRDIFVRMNLRNNQGYFRRSSSSNLHRHYAKAGSVRVRFGGRD